VNDQVIRIVAATAAVGIFAYPFVAPYLAMIPSWLKSNQTADPVKQKMRDVETVLNLSSRFLANGPKEGVDLCQKLIDVILKASK
jgi:hypothetical protein